MATLWGVSVFSAGRRGEGYPFTASNPSINSVIKQLHGLDESGDNYDTTTRYYAVSLA